MDCTAVQTLDDIDNDFLWKDYTYFSSQSSIVIQHFSDFVDFIEDSLGSLNDYNVLDIGSNDGSLLLQFKDKGASVVGIDPSDTVIKEAKRKGIKTHHGLFNLESANNKLKNQKFDIITAFNVFAHSADMTGMLSGVKQLLSSKGYFMFEVQYLSDISKKHIMGTFFHEHMIHYSYYSARRFLEGQNLRIINYQRNDIQNGSIVFIACHDSHAHSSPLFDISALDKLEKEEKSLGLDSDKWSDAFISKQQEIKSNCQDFLSINKIKSLAGYGAARSGPTLCIQYGLDGFINKLFDDHPSKTNNYSPYQNIFVEPTKNLNAIDYPYCVILAYIHYKPIIASNTQYLKDGGMFLLLWPFFAVVNKENYDVFLK